MSRETSPGLARFPDCIRINFSVCLILSGVDHRLVWMYYWQQASVAQLWGQFGRDGEQWSSWKR